MSGLFYLIISIFLFSCDDSPTEPPEVALTTKLYACDQLTDKVRIYDASTDNLSEIDSISIDFNDDGAFGDTPHFVVVDNLNGYWFVTTMDAGIVGMYSVEDDTLLSKIFVDDRPALMVVDPVDQRLYVSRMMSMGITSGGEFPVLNVLDYSSGDLQLSNHIELAGEDLGDDGGIFDFPEPHAISISEDGTYLYTASITTDWISQINLIPDPPQSYPFPFVEGAPKPTYNDGVLDPISSTQKGGNVFFSCSGGDVVQSWNAMLRSYQSTYDFSTISMSRPWHIIASPTSDHIFIALSGNGTGEGAGVASLSFNDTGLLTLEWSKDTEDANFESLHGITVSSDGSRVYVSSRGNGSLFTLDALTGDVLDELTSNTQLYGIATAQVEAE